MSCALKVSHMLIRHLNKEVLGGGNICTCENVQYVQKLGLGTGKLNSIRMLAAACHSNV